MIVFEIHLNGERVCTAGLREHGLASVHLSHWRGMALRDWGNPESGRELNENLALHIGGIDEGKEMHTLWFSGDIKVGDEIVIRVKNETSFDEPEFHPPPDPERMAKFRPKSEPS